VISRAKQLWACAAWAAACSGAVEPLTAPLPAEEPVAGEAAPGERADAGPAAEERAERRAPGAKDASPREPRAEGDGEGAIPPGSYDAARVSGAGVLFSRWEVGGEGGIDASPWLGFERAVAAESGSNPRPPKTTPIAFVPKGGAAKAPADGTLFLRRGRGARARLLWYGDGPGRPSVGAFWPARPGEWPIVISEGALSPGGPWRALARGDIDGDGTRDLAFVAEGVDGCDRGPCPLFWMVILASAAPAVCGAALTLVDTGTAAEFEKAVGAAFFSSSGDAPLVGDAVRWSGRAEADRYEVVARGPGGERKWTASLEEGVFALSAAPSTRLAGYKTAHKRIGVGEKPFPTPWGAFPWLERAFPCGSGARRAAPSARRGRRGVVGGGKKNEKR
jgi:hypothetical protein